MTVVRPKAGLLEVTVKQHSEPPPPLWYLRCTYSPNEDLR